MPHPSAPFRARWDSTTPSLLGFSPYEAPMLGAPRFALRNVGFTTPSLSGSSPHEIPTAKNKPHSPEQGFHFY